MMLGCSGVSPRIRLYCHFLHHDWVLSPKMETTRPIFSRQVYDKVDFELPRVVRPLRLLFAALDVPFPVTSGRRLRNWALLQVLAEQGHDVTMVYFEETEAANEDVSELRRVCRNLDPVPEPRRSTASHLAIWRRLQALTAALPYGAWRLRSPKFRVRLQEWLVRESFDALICDDSYVAANI